MPVQIVVRQISGLGNQLFQYAAGRYYAREHGAAMRVSVHPKEQASSHGYPRPFLLPEFSIRAPWGNLTRRDRFLLSKRPLFQAVSKPFKRFLRISEFTEPPEQRYRFLPRLPLQAGIVYLSGYWQTYRSVDAIEGELRDEFRFKEAARGETAEVMRQIQGSAHPVSLHIRRGDYTLAAEGRIALPLGYYLRAIDVMRSKLEDPTFFIFSDDMAFAKTSLPAGIKKVFVDHSDDFSAHEDLRLMACCRHHIIANSTFSWWGAWLNGAADKLVAAPKHWLLREDSYYSDLLPPGWLLLDSIASNS